MRHIIMRALMGIAWLGTGVYLLVNGNGEGIFSILMGVVFGFSALSMWKKNKGETK